MGTQQSEGVSKLIKIKTAKKLSILRSIKVITKDKRNAIITVRTETTKGYHDKKTHSYLPPTRITKLIKVNGRKVKGNFDVINLGNGRLMIKGFDLNRNFKVQYVRIKAISKKPKSLPEIEEDIKNFDPGKLGEIEF